MPILPVIGRTMVRNLLRNSVRVALTLLVILTGITGPLQSETLCCQWQTDTEASKVAPIGFSDARDSYYNPPRVTASPTAKLTYDQPKVSTMSGATGLYTPAVGTNASPISSPGYVQQYRAPAPAPVYRAPAPVYRAPVQQQQQRQAAPAPYRPPPPAPPPPPPRPQWAPGGRNEFNQWSPEQRQLAEQQYLGGDSDYTAQTGLYQKALDDFVRRITGRIEGFDTDAVQATEGNVKNEAMSINNLGEDFGARGLSYSGLFDKAKNKTTDRYKEGRGNIQKNRVTNTQNARNDEADYKSENEIGRGNARRSSLLRMASQQNLKDAQY